jgi:translocation and assembly module TamB
MRRSLRWLGWGVTAVLGIVVLLLAVVVGGSATAPGQSAIERLVPTLTGGEVRISGLSGWLFHRVRIDRITVRDTGGTWLTIDGLSVTWSPLRLLDGEANVRSLVVDEVAVARRPLASASALGSSGGASLPIKVILASVDIKRLDLAAPVAGRPASVAATGWMRLTELDRGEGLLRVRRLDGAGTYDAQGSIDSAGVHLALHLSEPAGGLIAELAGLPSLGAIDAEARLAGPLDAVETGLSLRAGPLRATANGRVDAEHHAADLTVNATAPAMRPRPDLGWQAVSVQAHVRGPFTKPEANATLAVQGLMAGTASVAQISATVSGNAGGVTLDGALTGVRLPGPRPDLLAAAPVRLTVSARLDAADRPVTFTVEHPLFTVSGHAETAGIQAVEAQVTVPEIAALAEAGGVQGVAGRLALALHAARRDEDTQFGVTGTIGLANGPGPSVALVGSGAKLDLQGTLHGDAVTLSRLDIDSGALTAGLTGTVAPGMLDLHWRVAVADLAKVQPSLSGPLSATGTVTGKTDDLAVAADLSGTVAAQGVAPGQVRAHVTLSGLPAAPTGHVQAQGTLLGAPLALDLSAQRHDQTVAVTIGEATWKSAHAEGQLQVNLPNLVPVGHVSFGMARLDDLRPLLGQTLSGSVNGALDGTSDGTKLTLTAQNAGLPGTASVARTDLTATVRGPTTHPVVDGTLHVEGIAAQGLAGNLQLTAKGPAEALAVQMSATLPNLKGAAGTLAAAATVDASARTVTLARLQADWKQVTLRLLAPARISLADGVAVDRLRLGLRQAVLEASGRVSPTLDLTARLDNLPASLAALADPGLEATGTITGEARLTGRSAQPAGTIRVSARGLRMTNGTGRALPAADLTATATLAGQNAHVDVQATAGASHLAVTGSVGLPGALDLRTTGAADLTLTDPILTPSGRRARGQVILDATITGTAAAPRVAGNARLANGAFRDFAQGIDLSDITATVRADGGAVRLAQLSAKAGPGTITAQGSVDLTSVGMPVDLHMTARDARALASDRLTATLDADLALNGMLTGALTASGHVLVRSANIRIPEHLPASVAVLDVRVAGAPAPPPASPPPAVALNLTIDAPQQIFVRGRGVDAELGGEVKLAGSSASLVPSGGFELRRGSFSLAGQTLTFTSGQVSFNGGSLTDPSLNFVASTTAGDVTANLTISGTASNPKIALSSTPTLPQDEVLSYLLYGTRTASLGPLEIAQIAATLASLSGAAPAMSNPLDSVRQALGLDRLSMGAGSQLEAGRYVARDVYVGARQSISGTGTQAVVQIDLAKGLKLEATAGTSTQQTATGAGGSADAASVGIKYQFQY